LLGDQTKVSMFYKPIIFIVDDYQAFNLQQDRKLLSHYAGTIIFTYLSYNCFDLHIFHVFLMETNDQWGFHLSVESSE